MNPLKRASEAFAAKAEKLQADVADFVLDWLGEPVTIESPDVADYTQDSLDEPFDARSFKAAQKLHQASMSRGRSR
jgi:hypothetical protein